MQTLTTLTALSQKYCALLAKKGGEGAQALSFMFMVRLRRKLKPHQIEGKKFLLSRLNCVLAWSRNAGKSTTALAAIETLADKQKAFRALILCPFYLTHFWEQEVQATTFRSVFVICGTDKTRIIQLKKNWKKRYRVLAYEHYIKDFEALMEEDFDAVIFDAPEYFLCNPHKTVPYFPTVPKWILVRDGFRGNSELCALVSHLLFNTVPRVIIKNGKRETYCGNLTLLNGTINELQVKPIKEKVLIVPLPKEINKAYKVFVKKGNTDMAKQLVVGCQYLKEKFFPGEKVFFANTFEELQLLGKKGFLFNMQRGRAYCYGKKKETEGIAQ